MLYQRVTNSRILNARTLHTQCDYNAILYAWTSLLRNESGFAEKSALFYDFRIVANLDL